VILNCRWQLVEIDTALTDLKRESEHVMSLIHPSNTYMVCILLLDFDMLIALLFDAVMLRTYHLNCLCTCTLLMCSWIWGF
jgi:hypothetical protein